MTERCSCKDAPYGCPLHPMDSELEQPESFVADVLHDCLSSFQGLDHGEGVCCFDREAAVAYLLSPASGLRIEVDE